MMQKKEAGVVAARTGNHAQGLAFAAQYFGCVAIFYAEATPLTKVTGVRVLWCQCCFDW